MAANAKTNAEVLKHGASGQMRMPTMPSVMARAITSNSLAMKTDIETVVQPLLPNDLY